MKFLSKLTAIGLAFSLAAGLAGCQSSNAETTSSAADTTSAAVSSESIPDLEVTIPLDDVTLPETTAASAESENASESTAGGEGTTAANGEVDLSKVVALTFDDGPDTKDTSSSNRILDVLEQYGCKATFFVQGQAAQDWLPERNKATVKREADLGMRSEHTPIHMLICASSRRMK